VRGARALVNVRRDRGVPVLNMERRAHNPDTITIRVRRPGTFGVQSLELCGHRLLGGHADTGIFHLVDSATLRPAPQLPQASRATRREDDDGLATATIEADKPLALAEGERCTDPYNRTDDVQR